jgi:signal peptidase I
MPKILDRSASRLPRPLRALLDWTLTIGGAVAIVLVFQAQVAKPYRIPTASMEPTLHCARPASGCLAQFSDRVIADRLTYRLRDPRRGEIVVLKTPEGAEEACGQSGTFVKRIIGLPGERVAMRAGDVYINGTLLDERSYLSESRQGSQSGSWYAGPGYFVLGDNRASSCDSRQWGSVAREDLIGPVRLTYWPPGRFSVR